MPWKVDEESKSLAMDDKGNPIWLNDAGEEKSVDYSAMSKSLSDANREAAQRKDKIKALEDQLKPYEGIEDFPAFKIQAEKDRAIVAAMPEKEQAVEERIRLQVEAATKPLKDHVMQLQKDKAESDARLQRETIANAFTRSAFIADKIHSKARAAVTDIFAKQFSIDGEGKLVATGADGQIIYGESGPAEFEEAIARLLDSHPSKEMFLAGKDSDGGGAAPGAKTPPNAQQRPGAPKSLADCKTKEERLAYIKNIKAEE